MHQNPIISRTVPKPSGREHIKVRGAGAATKGDKWYAVAGQVVDTAQKQPAEYVSNIKKA
tara:strand:- start:13655 stop:13834 length:180 start_codon:yes stop_codon:yes gene_type:complete